MPGNSYRTILKSTFIMGGASFANGLLGLMRNKVAALMLGPAGLGYIGIYLNLMQAGAILAALGTSPAGARQVAVAVEAEGDEIARVRKALFWCSLLLALIGALVFALLRQPIATLLVHDATRGEEVGWLAVGLFLTVAAGSQQALLTGMRKIADFGRMTVLSSLFSALGGVAILVWLGPKGILPFILIGPLFLFLFGHWYVAKLGRNRVAAMPLRELASRWKGLLNVGLSFAVVGIVGLLGLLAIRSLIQSRLGPDALGQFQAAWLVSTTTIGLVLSAMATDYMPRLAAMIADRPAAAKLVNDQIEVALLIVGPVMVALLAIAPWLMTILYSARFTEAVGVFQLQVFGDILRVAGWPLGLVLAVSGAGRGFMLVETLATVVFVLSVFILLPYFGIKAAALGYDAMYLGYLIAAMCAVRRQIGFRWTRHVLMQIAVILFVALGVVWLHSQSPLGAALTGLCIAAGMAFYALVRLGSKAELPGWVGQLVRR